jgi:mannosyltransferase OCH1-like enzyme
LCSRGVVRTILKERHDINDIFISYSFSMQWRKYIRKISYIVIVFFLLYIIVFRRRSSRVLLTVSHIDKFTQQKNSNHTHLHRIPRIIHQTWKTEHVPLHWNRTVESVRELNANQFEYRLWTDDDMHEFVRRKEPDLYQHTFLTYSLDIQRIDAFRYVILYHLGGLYIDMDNGCRQSFDSLLNILETLDSQSIHLAAFPRTSPIGISNGFMIATKGHPLFKILLSRLSLFNHNYFIGYLTVMLSAGPLYLSLNEFYFDQLSTQSAIRILDEFVYSNVYTWHTPGNSWHGRDAKIILYIYRSLRTTPSTVYIFLIGLIVLFLLYRRRFRCRKRKS